jgi:hypothetical protein
MLGKNLDIILGAGTKDSGWIFFLDATGETGESPQFILLLIKI